MVSLFVVGARGYGGARLNNLKEGERLFTNQFMVYCMIFNFCITMFYERCSRDLDYKATTSIRCRSDSPFGLENGTLQPPA